MFKNRSHFRYISILIASSDSIFYSHRQITVSNETVQYKLIQKNKKKINGFCVKKYDLDVDRIRFAVASQILPENEQDKLEEARTHLKAFLVCNKPLPEIPEHMLFIKEMCEKSFQHRAYAVDIQTPSVILEVLRMFPEDINITFPALETLLSMSVDQPNILDYKGLDMIEFFLKNAPDAATKQQVLKWIALCCSISEGDRVQIFEMPILPYLKTLLDDDTTTSPVIIDVCAVIKALCQTEDAGAADKFDSSRVELLADELLHRVTCLLDKFDRFDYIVKNILSTIEKLLVDNKYCERMLNVRKGRGLKYVIHTLELHMWCQSNNYQCLCLFYILAGNDRLKDMLIQRGAACAIRTSIERHLACVKICNVGLGCIAKLMINSPLNTLVLCDFGAIPTVLKAMVQHSKEVNIQKLGSWIIRLILTYNPSSHDNFSTIDVDKVLLKALQIHGSRCEYDVKAALEQLRRPVDMNERISIPKRVIEEAEEKDYHF